MSSPPAYKWTPLEDLPQSPQQLARPELRALEDVWAEQRDQLDRSHAVKEFLGRLQREWAIETGIIEGLYTLDRGITQTLIERGLDASYISREATSDDPEHVMQMIRDHHDVLEGLFDFVKGQRELTASYVKELHAALTRHQETTLAVNTLGRQVQVPLLRGEYKALPNNPIRPDGSIHEYCPPEQVASEMDRLIQLHKQHERDHISPEVEAAWFHHRFTQIHPFQDGNGRVARAIATLLFIKTGGFPLVITRDDRARYIDALEDADSGLLDPLIDLFTALQRKAFVKALSIAEDIHRRERVDQVIQAAREQLERRRDALREEWNRAQDNAEALQEIARGRFKEVANRLKRELSPLIPAGYSFAVDSEPPGGKRSHYFRQQIIETANQIDYYANTTEYRAWTRIILRTDTQAEILLSFHGIGFQFRGIVVASMCFFRREATESGEREVVGVTPVSDEVFQINYKESLAASSARFEGWVDDALTRALEVWRRAL